MNSFYRLVLLAFPSDFRRRHGAAMAQQVEEQRRVVQSRPVSRLLFWPRVIADSLRHGVGLRMAGSPRAPRSSRISPDLRQAWRSLVAHKGSSATSVGLLAVALTVSTTVFAIVDAMLLRPAPYAHSDRLFEIFTTSAQGTPGQPYMPIPAARLWMARTDLFAAAGGYAQGGAAAFGDSSQGMDMIGQVYATPGLFEAIGIQPMLGRIFVAGEGGPGNNRVVIVSESIWRTRLGADPAAVGRSVLVNGVPMTLVGVMPAAFTYPRLNIELWRPFDAATAAPSRALQMIVRTRADLSLTAARDRFASAVPGVMAATDHDPSDGRGWMLRPLTESWVPAQARQSLWVLAAAAGLLLLTAGANLSSLTMAQAFGRTRQMAIQSALGASRARLVRQALAEQVFVGFTALVVAVPLTLLAMVAARALTPDTLTDWTMHVAGLDLRAATAMAVIGLSTPVLAALAPAILASRTSVIALLQQDSRSSTGSRRSRVLRHTMVVTEIVCAVVLLVTGALLVRSFIALTRVDRGFDSAKLISATILFPTSNFPSPLSRRLIVDRVLAELHDTAGVAGVTLASGVPPSAGQISFGKIALDGQPPASSAIALPAYTVQPDFFQIAGIPIVAGRAFAASDDSTHVIVSQSFASAFWPGASAVGHRFRLFDNGQWSEVVGVAGEVRSGGLDDAGRPFEEYLPYVRPAISAVSSASAASPEAFSGGALFVVRSNDVDHMVPVIRATIARIDRRVLIRSVTPVESLYDESLAQPRMLLWLMVAFSVAGLLVAAIGVYGVLSSLVAQQLREIGVRLMLGADPDAMRRRVLRSGLVLAASGTIVGVVAAFGASRFVASVLFGIRPTDPASYLIVIGVLTLTAIAAAWLPARRAASVDPAQLLRES